ncbi:FecR family protein [Mucilaginibacter gracilis]|uniref:FecR family protein n=1 Tax=Mucilaginibacter gracilis TaxID=423350 RepID=A0A495IYS4_9SPHI|nr:FecR family protein [Mucilaginibacter gracilis]RKR81860.1 FecR family protein [Mucilaginibacter gracilis]
MDKHVLQNLLLKHKAGECSEEEIAILENWYLQWKPNEELQVPHTAIQKSVDDVWNRIERDSISYNAVKQMWTRIAAAAAILILFGTGIHFYRAKSKVLTPTEISAIMPGGNKAILTLSNGAKVYLADEPSGKTIKQTGVTIIKSTDGEVSYKADATNNDAVAYNTINTPNGGQFQIILPDGSHVWLNAASSIRYPTVFNGSERKVEVTGEVYFEVAKNAQKPFKVKINQGAEVTVLGTHFNINAYTNEPVMQTTLVEGAIRITAGNLSDKLLPGQQANVGHLPSGSVYLNKVEGADIEQVMAWKNNLFSFQDLPFDKAMRQLSRWYDVEVVYQDGVPDTRFGGEMGRDVNFSKVLFFLSKLNIHYRMEQGKRLVITK